MLLFMHSTNDGAWTIKTNGVGDGKSALRLWLLSPFVSSSISLILFR